MKLHIRVTKSEDGTIKRELMNGDYKVGDVTKTEIIEMLMNFSSSLRYD